MLAQAIFDLVKPILGETGTGVTYPNSEIIGAINDGQRFICINRLDACSSTVSIQLVTGGKQTIPATARRLLGITRNMGIDGNTPGAAIRTFVDSYDLDSFNPDWHNEVDNEVSEVIYDDARPDEFYVHPSTTNYIEIKTSDYPVDVTATTDSIAINEIYGPILASWVLYRLFSRDGMESPNYARGESHKQTVYEALGIKAQSDFQASPNQ